MIIVLKNNQQDKINKLCDFINSQYGNVEVHISYGKSKTILGLIGDTSSIDIESIQAQDIVESVKRVQEPYKKSNRKFHPDDTIITLENGCKIGGRHMAVIAGPCAVESQEQIIEIARAVKKSGANILRGGAFKARTSPYSFQGLGEQGLRFLINAKRETGLPIISEIMAPSQLPLFEEVDIIQVGARNMQNFELLKLLGKTDKPILLKRGLANSIEELLMSAEYIMVNGNEKIILCERGIRTFETMTRNTLDISAVPLLKKISHLPVVVDPSHAAGIAWLVEPLSMAAVAAGADGLIIEVHNNPALAKSDGAQSITPEMFSSLTGRLKRIMSVLDKEL